MQAKTEILDEVMLLIDYPIPYLGAEDVPKQQKEGQAGLSDFKTPPPLGARHARSITPRTSLNVPHISNWMFSCS